MGRGTRHEQVSSSGFRLFVGEERVDWGSVGGWKQLTTGCSLHELVVLEERIVLNGSELEMQSQVGNAKAMTTTKRVSIVRQVAPRRRHQTAHHHTPVGMTFSSQTHQCSTTSEPKNSWLAKCSHGVSILVPKHTKSSEHQNALKKNDTFVKRRSVSVPQPLPHPTRGTCR
jgi:hypothetical protein